jgi:hypothetical protein
MMGREPVGPIVRTVVQDVNPTRDGPTAEARINPKEHGYADVVLAFRDLDVVESVHDALPAVLQRRSAGKRPNASPEGKATLASRLTDPFTEPPLGGREGVT